MRRDPWDKRSTYLRVTSASTRLHTDNFICKYFWHRRRDTTDEVNITSSVFPAGTDRDFHADRHVIINHTKANPSSRFLVLFCNATTITSKLYHLLAQLYHIYCTNEQEVQMGKYSEMRTGNPELLCVLQRWPRNPGSYHRCHNYIINSI